jgi:hypothetical protein
MKSGHLGFGVFIDTWSMVLKQAHSGNIMGIEVQKAGMVTLEK